MNASSSASSLRFPHRHLLGIEGLSADTITMLLDLADSYVEQNRKPNKTLSLLEGRTASHAEAVFCELGSEKMVRQGPWKYVYHPEREVQQLFNLEEDPQELSNLSGRAECVNRERALRDRILDWLIETEPRPNSI